MKVIKENLTTIETLSDLAKLVELFIDEYSK